MGIIAKLGALRASASFGSDVKELHILQIKVPASSSEYRPATVNYPGFAENVETVAILPTLVSYDFTHKTTPYFQSRCVQLGRVGTTVRKRLQELRASGHKQWKATAWAMEAGKWKKDLCFFSDYRKEIRQVQSDLNRLGYRVGAVDGVLGPRTTAGIRSYQADQKMPRSGTINPQLLSALRRGRPAEELTSGLVVCSRFVARPIEHGKCVTLDAIAVATVINRATGRRLS